jgi:hypothetical protein
LRDGLIRSIIFSKWKLSKRKKNPLYCVSNILASSCICTSLP